MTALRVKEVPKVNLEIPAQLSISTAASGGGFRRGELLGVLYKAHKGGKLAWGHMLGM